MGIVSARGCIKRWTFVCAAALLLAACGGDDEPSSIDGGNSGGPGPTPPGGNVDLSVSAGSDRTVDTGTDVTLTATASLDDVTYQWTVIAQPSGAVVNIAAANTPRMEFTPFVEGSYLFRVTVNDQLSNSAHDEITVASVASGDLETYEPVAGHTSDRWTVIVSQGAPESSPVLYNDNSAFANNSSQNHWTQFSFTGEPVEVVVSDLVEDVTTCVVRPLHDAISAAVNTTVDSCTFTITEPGQWFVDTGDYEEPLFIFASEIDTTVPIVNGTTVVNFDPASHIGVPWPGDIMAVVFEPGVYNLDPNYVTPTDDQWDLPFGVEVYIKGGAWVNGGINVDTGTGAFKLRGRGTLSGSIYDYINGNISRNLLRSGTSGTTTVEGVTFSDGVAPLFRSYDSGLVVRDVKFFGGQRETGAVRMNANGLLEDSFFKTNDDNINMFGSNITARDLVMWAQTTGCQIQLSWNQSASHANNLVQDIDVIHNDGTDGNYTQTINRGVVCSRHLNGGNLHDQLFDDFRIEVAMFQLFSFTQQWDLAGFDVGTGSLDGMTFSNWDVARVSLEPEWFNGNGTSPGTIANFVFENITIDGVPLDDSNFLCEGGANCASFTIAQ